MSKMRERLSALRQNYRMTKQAHRWVGWEMLGLFLVVTIVVAAPVAFFVNTLTGLLISIPLGLLAATFWFSRRAMNAAYTSIEGQPGAAAAVVEQMRGNWTVTPAVAVTRNSDIVSRVIGRCGVVLIGEGPSQRVTHLLANERKKTARWLPEVPIYEIQVGIEEGQVRIGRLQRELSRLPSTIRPAEVNDIRRRLDALSAKDSPVPIPKGPMPKGGKIPKSMRG
ncbi:MAG: DUF4191 domain-containing protein [Candidatus Nanopelagicales bacterium]|jgi:hypothetical protein